MKRYVKPEFCFIRNTGGMTGRQMAGLSAGQFEAYMQKTEIIEARKKYRISPNYMLRKIGGDYAIIPVGSDAAVLNAVMTPNRPAVFIWNEFVTPSTEEDVAVKCAVEFDGQIERIREDVHQFVTESLELRILEEVKE